MAEEATRQRLGRGLAALIGEAGEEAVITERGRGARRVPVAFLRANPANPRKHFAEADLEDLTASVREKGVVQPILVRSVSPAGDLYEIIAGERRWRAAQRAGVHDVPVVLLDVTADEALELAIIENVQRADLNAIEEAQGYEALIARHQYGQADVARIIGKSRSHITNTLRLLKLPQDVREAVSDGRLSAGHARALLTMDDPSAAAQQIIAGGLSVREAEALNQKAKDPGGAAAARKPTEKDADTLELEKVLTDSLGLVVRIDHKGPGGQIVIRYANLEQLDGVCRRLKD